MLEKVDFETVRSIFLSIQVVPDRSSEIYQKPFIADI